MRRSTSIASSTIARCLVIAGFAMVVSEGACLPGDSRPTPGSVTVTVESSDATRVGLTTGDGWSVHFERVVAAIGDLRLDDYPDRGSDGCNDYSDSRYDRLFDFTRLPSPARVGVVYGLGRCSLGFRLRPPSADTLLQTGVTEADVTFMRVEASDANAENERIGLRVVGRAERDGAAVAFDWSFRPGYEVSRCPTADGTGFVNAFDLAAHDARTLRAVVRVEELFREAPSDDAAFAFDPIASADADADGVVTIGELAGVPLPPGSSTGFGGQRFGRRRGAGRGASGDARRPRLRTPGASRRTVRGRSGLRVRPPLSRASSFADQRGASRHATMASVTRFVSSGSRTLMERTPAS